MSLRPALALPAGLATVLLLSACASEQPYLLTDYRYHQIGQVRVCYSETTADAETVRRMAEDVCAQYDRTAIFQYQQKHQCSWTAPTLAYFRCQPRPGENPAPVLKKNAPLRHEPRVSDN
jgi:hypothetical protein